MKCCNENKEGNSIDDNKGNKRKGIKAILHLVLCCGLPVLILLVAPFIIKMNPMIGGALTVIAPFICPIMMLFMVSAIFKKSKNKC